MNTDKKSKPIYLCPSVVNDFMLEIEAKIKVEDFSAIKDRLNGLGAASIGQYQQTNTFFDTPARSLLAADQGLRLRRQHDLSTSREQFILTFKGPCQAGALKKREERELVVASASDAVALLESLGYQQIFQFEKCREIWPSSGCEIALDELATLGRFVEIEGPDEPAIQKVVEQLGLAGKAFIRESYVALLMNHSE